MPLDQASGYRLSPQQRRIWELQQDGSIYNTFSVVELRGRVESSRLQSSLAAIVERHQIFQSVFFRPPGLRVPRQVVVPNPRISWQELDWTNLTQQQQQDQSQELLNLQATYRFNFGAGPLVSCTLVSVGQERYLLLIVFPALCGDSVTLANVLRETSELYRENPTDLVAADKIVQYCLYSDWTNELLAGPEGTAGKTYWQSQSAHSLPDARLPLESRQVAQVPFCPRWIEIDLPEDCLEFALRRQFAVTEFGFTCWQVLLARMTGESDLLVSRTCSGRDYEELEFACGPFARNLPCVSRLSGNLRFSDLLSRNVKSRSEAEEWQTCFVVDSESRIAPFAYEFEQWAFPISTDHVRFTTLFQRHECDRYKLKLKICQLDAKRWKALLDFDPVYLDRDCVERYGRYLTTLMRGAAQNPDCFVENLQFLSEADQHEVLNSFNPRDSSLSYTMPVFELVERIAARTPERIAVRCNARAISYRDLARQSNQLAHHLIKQGVRPEMPVAILADRSPETIVGLLGILKAGGAYVPLDPAYPRDRLAFVIKDIGTRFVVCSRRAADVLPENGAQIISHLSDWDAIAREPDSVPAVPLLEDNLAYVIYTSGSTGQPKGTLISHKNLALSTLARQDYYCGTIDNFLLLSSFSFDSSVAGIFWTLCTGGTLYLLEEKQEIDISTIAETIRRFGVSHLLCLPSLYALLLSQVDPDTLVSLRTVIVAGEACPKDLVAAHDRLPMKIKLYNEYGPTENTVWSTVAEILPNKDSPNIPIGHPIATSRVYLLDSEMQPAPFGVEAEVYLGGGGLSRGYLGLPTLTAERFVPDPFGAHPGGRLYKTGDLAAYQKDGQIEFHGRADQQVKLRGYRIELGEIEAALRKASGIRDAVAIVREDEPGDPRLVAYVVLSAPVGNREEQSDIASTRLHMAQSNPGAAGGIPEADALRDFLRTTLPEFMVPLAIEVMEQFPRLPNGKIDRKALPVPLQNRSRRAAYIPPTSDLETKLAALWTETLKLEQVGIDDNFFDLGGHSFLVIKIHYRLSRLLGQEVPLLKLFEFPTIRALAQFLEHRPEPAQDRAGVEGIADWAASRRQALEKQRALVQKIS
jgi:amino acid adenylation domain-containing protein